ncbi:MAG: GLPGLI family protein [Muribaculaceae bacterium]|nr:GLPGLI family protein [Muribaculaceae bacterium]
MNRLITSIIMCLVAIAAMAQTADIEVSYNYKHFHRTGKEQNHQMILLACPTYSKFYNPITEYLDSLESTPEGMDVYNQMKMAAFTAGNIKDVPSRKVPMYVFKHKNGDTEVFDGNVVLMFQYTEPYESQKWEICDSTKNILGYDCIMACADYRGRHWTAWFAPDIPIQDGPWKLSGLPGLILEATENSGQHQFTATGINATKKQITQNLGSDHYERTNRIDMLKTLRRFEDDPISGLSVAMGRKITVRGDVQINKSLDFLETDYR